MTTDDNVIPLPNNAEVAQARAYITGVAHGFAILLGDWTGQGNGTATSLPDKQDGTRLIYTGDELHPFDAVIPCNRHGRHRVGVTWPAQLDKARADTAACGATTPAPQPVPEQPPMRPRLAVKPTPLYLITRAADTPGKDRQQPAS